MKVTVKETTTVRLDSLEVGRIFQYNGQWLMRLPVLCPFNDTDDYNAWDMDDKCFRYIDAFTLVQPLRDVEITGTL